MTHEFTPWPRTMRLFRDMIVTEKIDGTNAAIHVCDFGSITAQSRNRIITPESDNYGFARWAHDNADALARTLGPGLHFGEWWGHGIQRGYGLTTRRFSLFNTDAHADTYATIGDSIVTKVPVLHRGVFSTGMVRFALASLRESGSAAAPGFMAPEGVCVFHVPSRKVFKVTLDNQDAGKWEATK